MNIVKPMLLVMAAANVCNVIFCVIFIAKLRMGVDGAALAMVLTGVCQVAFCFIYILKSKVYAGMLRR